MYNEGGNPAISSKFVWGKNSTFPPSLLDSDTKDFFP